MNKTKKKVCILFALINIAMILMDQITKAAIVKNIELYNEKTIINGFFSFYHTRNTGSAFSFLADKSWGIYVLSFVSVIMAVVILLLTIRSIKLDLYIIAFAMSLLFSGAVGNLIDRFRLKYVVDFLSFTFGSYSFAIFNVADVFAVCGTILLIVIIIFQSKKFDLLLASFESNKKETPNANT